MGTTASVGVKVRVEAGVIRQARRPAPGSEAGPGRAAPLSKTTAVGTAAVAVAATGALVKKGTVRNEDEAGAEPLTG